jgi:hypothetical protein
VLDISTHESFINPATVVFDYGQYAAVVVVVVVVLLTKLCSGDRRSSFYRCC